MESVRKSHIIFCWVDYFFDGKTFFLFLDEYSTSTAKARGRATETGGRHETDSRISGRRGHQGKMAEISLNQLSEKYILGKSFTILCKGLLFYEVV